MGGNDLIVLISPKNEIFKSKIDWNVPCKIVLFLFLVIVLSVLVRFMDSDYPFVIFKLFFARFMFHLHHKSKMAYSGGHMIIDDHIVKRLLEAKLVLQPNL